MWLWLLLSCFLRRWLSLWLLLLLFLLFLLLRWLLLWLLSLLLSLVLSATLFSEAFRCRFLEHFFTNVQEACLALPLCVSPSTNRAWHTKVFFSLDVRPRIDLVWRR